MAAMMVAQRIKGNFNSATCYHPGDLSTDLAFLGAVQWKITIPCADQRAFTEAGWGGEEGEFVLKMEILIESFDQMQPGYEVRP